MSNIDTSSWQEFRIGDLFEKLELKRTIKDFDKKRDISTCYTKEFNLPLVNAKCGNNGIMYYGRRSDFECADMCIDIVNDGAASVGNVYAQAQETGVLYNAYLIRLKDVITSEEALLFLATVLQKAIKHNFSYDNKASWDKVQNLGVKLPVTTVYEPDFDYMEKYIRIQKKLAIKDAALLKDKIIEETKKVVGC